MKNGLFREPRPGTGLVVVLLALSMALWFGCGNEPQSVTAPGAEAQQEVALSKAAVQDIGKVMEIQDRHTRALLGIEGVVGTATTALPDGRYAVKILTRTAGLEGRLPKILEGVPVVVEVVGEIRALGFAGERFDPVKTDVSGGNGNLDKVGTLDVCSSGTIGSIVMNGDGKFFLSNNHVFARSNAAAIGEDIVHPGLADFDCDRSQVRHVADLAAVKEIQFIDPQRPLPPPENRMDAAIAKILPGVAVSPMTACGYTPSSSPVAAMLGMAVKKCGRTTALTTGEVTGLNVTVVIQGYSADRKRFAALFTGQIQTTGMSAGGDSGSLLVTDDGKNRPVGLLFAGSETTTLHNPIMEVLAEFGVSVMGN